MFTSSDIKSLQEAYQAVYDDELRSEIVEDDDLFEDLEIIDELSDEELDEIVEEIVYEMLDEGYDIDDVEYIFEDVLVEARSARRRTGGPSYAEVMAKIDAKEKAPKAKAKAQPQPEVTRQSTSSTPTPRSRRRGRSSREGMSGLTPRKQEERAARRQAEREASEKSAREAARRARRERIGSAVKGALSKAGEMAKDVKQRIGAKLKGAKAVAQIAGSIAKDEAKRARRSAEHQAGKAAQAVASAPGRAVGAAKSGLKGLIRKGAERVQRGAEGVARRMSEEIETFDIVLDFLLSEGIVETLEDAQWVMVNELDYEDIDAILEAYEIDEATAMAKRGLNEPEIRRQIAARTKGGGAADRATELENRPTYGDTNRQNQRQTYARAQRGDFRRTTSSSPGLHGYAYQSNDPKVKAKQDARGAQRGVLTSAERRSLGR